MEPFSFYILFYAYLLFLSLFYQPAQTQQAYLNSTQFNCSSNPAISKGYLCDGSVKSCQAYVTFRSQAPSYDTAISIAYLLGSDASAIASINKISPGDKIPTNKLIVVPVSCSCSGNIFQHSSPYTVKKGDTYFHTANDTYQGLTTCQAMVGQNYYDPENITVGAVLTVPLRCACPSQNQTVDGITSLLTYIIAKNDTIASIGNMFGVSGQSVMGANMLSQDSIIDPNTTLLVPLKSKKCLSSDAYVADGSLEYLNCIHDGKRFPVKLVTLLGIGIGIAFICLSLSGYKLYQCLERRKIKIHKEKLFKQNGGFLLQEKYSSYGSTSNKAKLFTAEELEKATDNYNQSRFLGQGGYGTVYKGMLTDGTIVAVKRSRAIDANQIEQFINEVVILSQINHRHIVKLLGCCLETEFPVLVYEYIPNGTLSHHIKPKDTESSLSWENRFRIACEVAGAVAYMHSAASIPIFHRDIKSSNILVDHKYSAKVSDFGTSKSVPLDKTHLTTEVQGTFGYMDPEYFQSSIFTDKSDTYSFGVTLVEILTGQTPFSFAKDEGENLVASFISLTRENQLVQILDPQVAREADKGHIRTIAELATRCLRLNGKKRPTMKEVSTELEGLRNTQRCLEMFQEPQPLRDERAFMHSTSEVMQQPIEQSIDFYLEMESASV